MNNRSKQLNNQSPQKGDCVIYFMSRDQRVRDNFALIAAQEKALSLKLPLVVCFVFEPRLGNRSQEQSLYMLKGLQQVATDLSKLKISFIYKVGWCYANYKATIKQLKPATIFFDFSPLGNAQLIQSKIAKLKLCEVVLVDTHNIIPAWFLSTKQEFAAHTIRRKVHQHLPSFLVEPPKLICHPYARGLEFMNANNDMAVEAISGYPVNSIIPMFKPGEQAARAQLKKALKNIDNYALGRNDPNQNAQTGLSPYLHFGQISSLRVVLELLKETTEPPLLFMESTLASASENPTKRDSINALIEEIVVRKELADNYCFYNPNYKNINGAHSWAQATLTQHASDGREFIYSLNQFEKAATHDTAWNAAQNQVLKTGKMHGYMRMYWAKKILEWSESPEQAIEFAMYLNDKYSIDGGDPNGYAGIMWSIAGVHDRPWFERPIFGKIRYMNYAGLKRKFDLSKYESTWN